MRAPRIYLIGYMGSGKTGVGKKLSKHAGYDFIDLDEYIESKYGKSIPDIFSGEGEARFRELERKYLHEVSALNKVVISAGGGTPCFFDNMDFMNRTGLTVYLRMTSSALARRLENARTHRPLLQGLEGEELKSFIRSSLEKREPFYRQASVTVKGENISIAEVLKLLS
jgi:shikimate kinase